MESDYIVREARGRRLEPDRIDGRQQRKGEGEGSEHAIASKKVNVSPRNTLILWVSPDSNLRIR